MDPREPRLTPPEPHEPGVPSEGRRSFLAGVTLGAGGLIAAALAVPFLGLLFSPLQPRRRAAWRTVGRLDDFPIGDTVKVTFADPDPREWAGAAGRTAAWLRREADTAFVAFSAYCTHVGCPVRWVAGAKLFLCPCHGGAFRADGSVAAGPPPRPLARYDTRVRDGLVELRARGIPLPGETG